MSRATAEKFQYSIKVPETITRVKRLDVNKGAITLFEEFLDIISPLRTANKLGAQELQFLFSINTTKDNDIVNTFNHNIMSVSNG